jgi:hypothetical protein
VSRLVRARSGNAQAAVVVRKVDGRCDLQQLAFDRPIVETLNEDHVGAPRRERTDGGRQSRLGDRHGGESIEAADTGVHARDVDLMKEEDVVSGLGQRRREAADVGFNAAGVARRPVCDADPHLLSRGVADRERSATTST